MSRRPQQTEQAERVDGGGEALQRRQHRHGQLRLPPRAEQPRLPPPAEPLRLPPRAAEQRVWLGAGARSEPRAHSDGVIGDSGPAGEGAPVGQALQRARSHRARSHARVTLQNVAKEVPGSSSSHTAEAVGSGLSPAPFPLRPILLRMPEEGVAVGLGGGAPQAVRSGSPLAALAVPDATPLPASRPPSDRAAKRASSIAANRQKQLNALMALEEGSSCHSSDEGEHVARASGILDEDFGDAPEEAACSPTSSRRLSVGQAMSSPSI